MCPTLKAKEQKSLVTFDLGFEINLGKLRRLDKSLRMNAIFHLVFLLLV